MFLGIRFPWVPVPTYTDNNNYSAKKHMIRYLKSITVNSFTYFKKFPVKFNTAYTFLRYFNYTVVINM